MPVNIAILASGAGTNAKNIIEYFSKMDQSPVNVALIVCNKKGAGVLSIAEQEKIPSMIIEKERFFDGDGYLGEFKKFKIDMMVLAGFLWKVPKILIEAFPKKIINIHPALLPKYGGKGMYGGHVHRSVLSQGETESGITIHYVDEQYDNGDIILQVKCPVLDGDTPDLLAERVHALEYANYPLMIAELARKF